MSLSHQIASVAPSHQVVSKRGKEHFRLTGGIPKRLQQILTVSEKYRSGCPFADNDGHIKILGDIEAG